MTPGSRAGDVQWRTRAVATLLLVVFATQAVSSLRQKSVAADEQGYIAAGYYHLRTGKFDMNVTSPPLMKLVVALPLLALDPELPQTGGDPRDWSEHEQGQWAHRFLYENRVDADTLLGAARMPVVALGVLLGVLVFRWASELYGARAGLLALLLYTFCPNVLAHTRLATHDLGLAVFLFLTVYLYWRYLEWPSVTRLLVTALAFSAALLAKTAAVFLVPMAGLHMLILIRQGDGRGVCTALPLVARIAPANPRARQAVSFLMSGLIVGIVALLAVNAIYRFDGTLEPMAAHVPVEKIYEKVAPEPGPRRNALDVLLRVPMPLPAPLVQAATFQAGRVASGNTVYLAGALSREGWWYHMLVAALIKTPIPLLVLIATSVGTIVVRRRASSAESLILVVVVSMFTLFAVLSSVSIGLRYVLPVFPLLHVLVARLVRDGVELRRWAKAGVVVLVAWQVVGTLRIHPHYLAHFNELVGGPRNGYKYLADSNLDWGQDLKGLKRYMDEHGIDRIRLAYFGAGDAEYYGIDYDYLPSVGLHPPAGGKWWFEIDAEDLPPLDLSEGPTAVSATLVAGIFLDGYYAWLREVPPSDQVGYSILIYEPQ